MDLLDSAKSDNVRDFEIIDSKYQDPTLEDWKYLREACLNGSYHVIEHFLTSLDYYRETFGSILETTTKFELLSFAVRSQSSESIDLLLQNIETPEKISTEPIKWAFRCSNLESAEKLLTQFVTKFGLDANFEDGLVMNVLASTPDWFRFGEMSGLKFYYSFLQLDGDPRKSDAYRIAVETENVYFQKLLVATTACLENNSDITNISKILKYPDALQLYGQGELTFDELLSTATKKRALSI